MKQLSFFELYNHDTDFPQVFKRHKVVHCLFSPTINSPQDHFFKLAQRVGTPMVFQETQSGEILINQWTEEISDKTNEHTSESLHVDYGHLSFEMYGAYQYCMEQPEEGGMLHFVDADRITFLLKEKNPSLLESIQKTKVQFGLQGNQFTSCQDFILQQDDLGWKINWDYNKVRSDATNKGIIEDFKGFLDTSIENSDEVKPIVLKPGEGVFYWDRRVLHGQTAHSGSQQINRGGVLRNMPREVLNLLPKIQQNPSVEGVYEPTGHLKNANKILGQFEPHTLTTIFKELIEHFDEN